MAGSDCQRTPFCTAVIRREDQMASRVIHYIVGQLAAERISLKNPEDFIFGNLLPDCVDGPGGRKGAKARSHFWHYDTKNHTKGQNWHLFWDKYECHREDELYLGYMCHLVTDAVWLRHLIFPLKKRDKDGIWSMEILYRDYHRLNELLRKDFQPAMPELLWQKNDIEEADRSVWEDFRQELLKELWEDTGAREEDLEIMRYDFILDFLQKAVNTVVEEIEAKKAQQKGRDPREFYVPDDK